MAEQNLIDRAAFDRLLDSLGGDTEFLVELLKAFYDDSPRQLAALEGALVAGNEEDLRRAAHSLKSNSANFGAVALSKQCKELEDLAKAGVPVSAPGLVAAIELTYEHSKAELEALAGAL